LRSVKLSSSINLFAQDNHLIQHARGHTMCFVGVGMKYKIIYYRWNMLPLRPIEPIWAVCAMFTWLDNVLG
jgi:hypothetical protein